MTHRILLTGASGMLGSRAAQALCEQGHRVVGVDRAEARCAHPNYVHARCDLTRPDDVAALFDAERPDRVIHLAALAHVTGETDLGWNRYFRLNVLISQHVFENAARLKIPVFFASTVDVYGVCREVIDERTPLNPVGGYAESKRQAERRLHGLMGDTPFMIARFAPIYTEDDRHDIRKRFYLKFPSLAFTVGKGTEYRFLAIARAVEAVCEWARRDEAPKGVVNIGDAGVMDSAKLVAVERAEGRAKHVLRLPECVRALGVFAARFCPAMLRLNVNKVLKPQRFDLNVGEAFLSGGAPAEYVPQPNDLRGVRVLLLEGFARQNLALMPALKALGCHVTTYNSSKLDVGYASRWPDVRLLRPWNREDADYSWERLRAVLAEGHYDVTIPTTDFSARLLADHFDEVSALTHPAENGPERFYRLMDKLETMRFCARAGVPHPRTAEKSDSAEDILASGLSFPFVIKPRIGYGGIGFHVVENEAALREAFERTVARCGPVLAQEFIPQTGRQYQCQVFLDDAGEVRGSVLFDKTRWYPVSGGSSCCNTTLHDDAIAGGCARLLKAADWRGYADVDLIEDPRDGRAKVMEVNPRVTGGVKLCFAAGSDPARQLVELALGLPVADEMAYRDGVRLRYMHTDLLWLLKSPNRFKTKPGWFDFRRTTDQIFSLRDPWPWLTYSIQAVKKYRAEMAKRG